MAKEEKKDFDLGNGVGFLHLSKDKTQKESPDYFGSINVNNVTFAIGGWKKQNKAKTGNFITLNLDIMDATIDERKERRKEINKDLKADIKANENKDAFILAEQTGTLHSQNKEDVKEDFFGKVMIDGKEVYITGVMLEKNDKPYILLNVSDGLKTKEERAELKDSFL